MTVVDVQAPAQPKAPARRRFNGVKAFAGSTMLVVCLVWIVPTLGLFITSFRTLDAASSTGWWTVFTDPSQWSHFTFSNYREAISGASLGQGFINSFAIALPATFIPILVAAFAAYAFTFMHFKGRDTLFLIIVGMLVIPNYVALVPVLSIYNKIGLTNTDLPIVGTSFGQFLGLWLAHMGFGMSMAVYILRNYMITLPRSVIESAEIDGASHFQTFWHLILPMSVPALASFAIFQFLWVWNDLLVALVFIGPGDNAPVTVGLSNLLTTTGQGWNVLTAGGFFSMLVPIAVFLGMQRFFVRGLTAGAVKG